MIYRIADFNIEIKPLNKACEQFLRDYLVNGVDKADFLVETNAEDIEKERHLTEEEFSDYYLETIAILRKISDILPDLGGFLLHSSCIDVEGNGVCFAALSGTGKTTHTLFWQELLGDKMKIVNGDKPFVRNIGGGFFAYGTPWCGKENLSLNTKTEIRHLCFIIRDSENFVKSISPKEAVDMILRQVHLPKKNGIAIKTLNLINNFLNSVSLWEIHCLPEIDAAKTAYNTLFKGE